MTDAAVRVATHDKDDLKQEWKNSHKKASELSRKRSRLAHYNTDMAPDGEESVRLIMRPSEQYRIAYCYWQKSAPQKHHGALIYGGFSGWLLTACATVNTILD
jgi:hypothetical protein